ncbi:MAG: TIGR00730 family Rossman fold protein [Desulfobacter sp.]|nr:TIGR00730 family Rossman fold protein [Desulfobacter sp.]WDP86259.1 MAG: TIGR00730 family Rossman fold protein [Desulfobacter sp.]
MTSTKEPLQYPIDDFKSGESWRLFKIMGEFVEGIDTLHNLGPAVSIFGSARTDPKHPDYQRARDTAALFASSGYAVITGGGPGIMQAANQGAKEAKGKSIGLKINLPFEEKGNPYLTTSVDFHYFFVRKVMFVKYAQAYIIMPGGLGTLDEMFETLTLVQTRRIRQMPVILMDKKFWSPLLDWIKTQLVERGLISPEDLDLFHLAQDPDQALKIVQNFYQ